MSFSLHSSTVNLGGGRRSGSSGSNSRISFNDPEKSSIGLMSRKVSANPFSRNHRKESRCIEIRSGSGRTSSKLANENRSRVTGREGKGLLLKQGGCESRQGARRSRQNDGMREAGEHGNMPVYAHARL